MKRSGARLIVSEDPDFDRIEWVEKIWLGRRWDSVRTREMDLPKGGHHSDGEKINILEKCKNSGDSS